MSHTPTRRRLIRPSAELTYNVLTTPFSTDPSNLSRTYIGLEWSRIFTTLFLAQSASGSSSRTTPIHDHLIHMYYIEFYVYLNNIYAYLQIHK